MSDYKVEYKRAVEQYNGIIDTQLQEIARLKAEVEQSKRINTELLVLSERQASDIRRLTKAGDAMMGWIDRQHDDSGYPFSEAWEAAKQGGQP